jgi:hypothetical protein
MATTVVTNQLPPKVRRPVADAIVAKTENADGDWEISLTSDTKNNAWDVEVSGPDKFHWARRFSGEDRDAEVIAQSVRSAIEEVVGEIDDAPNSPELNDALSSLAIQGIAFTDALGHTAEREFVVDRVQLKESELVQLHKQGALTVNGLRSYLLTRNAA